MNISLLCCLIVSTVFCFSEEYAENLEALKDGIELGQKILDEKVVRYNDLLKQHHKKKQGIKNYQKIGVVADKKENNTQQPKETADERELRLLSLAIEEEQAVIDKRVEDYNKTLQKKSDKEAQDKERDNLLGPLHEEIRRLTHIVEQLQKDINELKQPGMTPLKVAISPERKNIQNAFEQALADVKNNVREGITKLVNLMTAHPDEVLAIEANLQLGNAYNQIGRWDDAYAAFDSVMTDSRTIIPQIIEAKLGMAETQIGKNDRESACMTLIQLEKSNNPMSQLQLDRYQRLLVDYHCSSKMDRDERKKEKTNKNVFID
ncbi:MAG: hypothetical protein COY39_04990 [Alphaproteobacteria bacterium CG_4_10_14_0_8_um_filter_37_21]|nr:MAG: hypothetical protein COY39_04990 [Alphaproteobacteria bacterium CG_4_10_14_0_8_um_filter_37_21]